MSEIKQVIENGKEACKTYIEQTKLLVTLASAFLMAPAALFSLMKAEDGKQLISQNLQIFVISEVLLIASVLLGYLVLASISGSQAEGKFDVYRLATRIFSIGQIVTYLVGLGVFVILIYKIFQ